MRGLTLIELLLVIAILLVVSSLAIPFIQSFQTSADLAAQADILTTTLRLARLQAVTGAHDSGWGVYFDTDNRRFILFKGDGFGSRDARYDQEFRYPASIAVTTDLGGEIQFNRYSGDPSASGTIELADETNQARVLINAYGKIETAP